MGKSFNFVQVPPPKPKFFIRLSLECNDSTTKCSNSSFVGELDFTLIFMRFNHQMEYYNKIIFLQSEMVVFKVSGLFKEQGLVLNDEELMLGFSRTFVLKRVAAGVVC